MSTAPLIYTPTIYDISIYRDGYAVIEVSHGGFSRSVVERGFDCEAEAQNRIDELLGAEAEERAEQAEALAIEAAYIAANKATTDLAKSVADFLWAADRGRFGSSLNCGDAESAYLTDLRDKLAAVQVASALAEAHA